ncbi:MAG: DUF362 domain-containing protein [Bacilli bacterium]|nr:DUF362 domain-containing protein [Bacilli bacterium]
MDKSKVYFSKKLTKERVIDVFNALNFKLTGNVGVKVHSGEPGNQNFLRPEFLKPMIDYVEGTVIECNTAYPGGRHNATVHKRTFDEHGWTKYFPIDIMDEEDNDVVIDIPNGTVIKKDYLGNHINKYDSILVLSHFKGHPMGGFGGALKQLSIGFASSRGKAYIHSAGRTTDPNNLWGKLPPQNDFLASMADAASGVHKMFKGRIAYVSLMVNMSVDCDCCSKAEDPCINDIGILASLDPIALDQACLDLVKASNDPGVAHFMERVNSRNGTYILEVADKLGFGNRDYELISID